MCYRFSGVLNANTPHAREVSEGDGHCTLVQSTTATCCASRPQRPELALGGGRWSRNTWSIPGGATGSEAGARRRRAENFRGARSRELAPTGDRRGGGHLRKSKPWWAQGSPNPGQPDVPVWTGTKLVQIQNLNSKKWKILKKFLKILQGATNLMVSNFLKNSFI